jgi:hypothetical protein
MPTGSGPLLAARQAALGVSGLQGLPAYFGLGGVASEAKHCYRDGG